MAYILNGSRTPFGNFLGSFAQTPASKLGSIAIKDAISKSKVSPKDINEVFMGQVLQASAGQSPARQAALGAELLESVPCQTINKVCGSGLQSIVTGSQTIDLGINDLIVAGGMENMTMAPFMMPQFRQGHKFGDSKILDHMQYDGLRDAYTDVPMGNCAEECAQKYKFSREEQDVFAIESFKRSQKAINDGFLDDEIAAVEIVNRKQTTIIDKDEGPFKVKFEKVPSLRPAFLKDGTITAANASTINDGAAAIILGSEKFKDLAQFKIVSYAHHAQNPTWFTTAPVEATKKCLEKASLSIKDIDYFEVNEAFAVVAMAALRELEIPHEKTNIYGGAISLGHPIGASGTRIVLALMNALKRNDKKLGLASICIGGGEAISMIIEKL